MIHLDHALVPVDIKACEDRVAGEPIDGLIERKHVDREQTIPRFSKVFHIHWGFSTMTCHRERAFLAIRYRESLDVFVGRGPSKCFTEPLPGESVVDAEDDVVMFSITV
jgi:hypothetical protein